MTIPKINTRSLTSLSLLWMFLTLLVSGVVLYVAPPGRIAHWTQWRLLGLTKENWQAVHTLCALAFLVGGLFHILKFNWGAVTSYLRRSRQGKQAFLWSVSGSILVAAAVIVGTLAGIPPFATVMELGERASQGWASRGDEPPVPHFEEQTLAQAAQRLGLDPADSVTILEAAGIHGAGTDRTLKEIGAANRVAPSEVYRLLSREAPAPEAGSDSIPEEGGGWGRMTVEAAARRLGVETDTAVERLAGLGLDVSPATPLREVAERAGLTPRETARLMARPEKTPEP